MRHIARSLRQLACRLREACSGIAMVEFAILAPVLLILYFGAIEVTQTVTAKRKLNLVAATLADLTARNEIVGLSDLQQIFGASSSIMTPVDTTGMKMRISSVIVSAAGISCVDWSVSSDPSFAPLAKGMPFKNLPSSLVAVSAVSRDYIVAEATFPFAPATHRFIPGTIQLSEGPTFLVPRKSDRVTADSTIQSSSPCIF